MDFAYPHRTSSKRFGGVFIVIVLHVAIVYALVTGLARKVVEVMQKPLETKIIEEIKKQDDTPPPPPPKLAPPPPSFVPPPEINIQTAVASPNAIAAVTSTPPPVHAAPVVAQVEAPHVPTRIAPVVDSRSCKTPEYPSASRRLEETGVVVLNFLIGVDGRVLQSKVESTSGHSRLDEAARGALSLCTFKPGTVDGKPEESWHKFKYVWQLER